MIGENVQSRSEADEESVHGLALAGLEGNQTAPILAILSICHFVLRHYRERAPKLLLIIMRLR
jgi:hypothetical protein